MNPIPVTDPDDPRVADFCAVRERDLAGRSGLFVAEGAVVFERLIASPWPVRAVLLAENRVSPMAPMLDRLPLQTPVYVAAQAVMDRIAGFPIHRGILALGERSAEPAAPQLLAGLPARALVVGLVGISNHDNMGGLFRNAAAFGADAVLVGPGCCDPLYRKAIRVSVGGVLTTPFARVEDDLAARLSAFGFEVLALSPSGREPLEAIRPADRCAVLFGAEGPGLPPELLARTRTVRIAMAGGFDSLNVATTSGIVLYSLRSREVDQKNSMRTPR